PGRERLRMIEPHLVHYSEALRPGLRLVGRLVVDHQGMGNGSPHRHCGIQRSMGILEYDLHPAPKGADLPLFELRDVGSLKHDLAFGRLHETKDCPSQGRLAGPGFPYETVDLAAVNVQGNPVDRVDEFLCSGQEPRKETPLDGKTA